MLEHQASEIGEGWEVFGEDGQTLGSVKEVHDDHVVVEKGLILKDRLYVPIGYVEGVAEQRVTLNVTSDQAGEMGWDQAPAPGAPGTTATVMTPSPSSQSGAANDQAAAGESNAADLTTMTGAGYGAGAGPAAGGSLGPTTGPDAQADRMGGSGRGGTSDLAPPARDQEPT